MSKKLVFLVSTLAATALLLVVLAGMALAKGDMAPSADYDVVADVDPTLIRTVGDHTIMYTILAHNPTPGITPTARITLTLDPNLEFADPPVGTITFPGYTLVPPQLIWTPELEYCVTETLVVYATASIETVVLPYVAYTTTVEWNGESEDLVTELDLHYMLYCPVIMLNVSS